MARRMRYTAGVCRESSTISNKGQLNNVWPEMSMAARVAIRNVFNIAKARNYWPAGRWRLKIGNRAQAWQRSEGIVAGASGYFSRR